MTPSDQLPSNPSLSQPRTKSSTKSRARPITRCDRCRQNKTGCDSESPCARCIISGFACIYSQANRTHQCHSSLSPSEPYHTGSIKSVRSKLNNLRAEVNFEGHLLKLIRPSPTPRVSFDLEIDNLPSLLSKLWLKEAPEQILFNTTNPFIVRVRQTFLPHWRASSDWSCWPISRTPRALLVTEIASELLPTRTECSALINLFDSNVNWLFGLYTRSELDQALLHATWFGESHVLPTSSQAWMDLATLFSVCRLALALDGWAHTITTQGLIERRSEIIHTWADLAVHALLHAGFEQNPSLGGMKVLITLISTLYFETDCGVLACSREMVELRRMALRGAYSMKLNRDGVTKDPQEAQQRRYVWWSLVTVDSHFGATGVIDEVIPLRESDVPLPLSPTTNNPTTGKTEQGLDLRSPVSRFAMGGFNNRCCELLARRRRLATVADIAQFDRDLLAVEESVRDEQRIRFTADTFTSWPKSPDADVWRGQQIFYVAIWHIRSKVHRGLLFTNQTSNPEVMQQVNFQYHYDVVKDSSVLLLKFYAHLTLPTAFISAIAGAAITLCIQICGVPTDSRIADTKARILHVLTRLRDIRSPIIVRTRRVLQDIMYICDSSAHTTPNSIRLANLPIDDLQSENFQERLSMGMEVDISQTGGALDPTNLILQPQFTLEDSALHTGSRSYVPCPRTATPGDRVPITRLNFPATRNAQETISPPQVDPVPYQPPNTHLIPRCNEVPPVTTSFSIPDVGGLHFQQPTRIPTLSSMPNDNGPGDLGIEPIPSSLAPGPDPISSVSRSYPGSFSMNGLNNTTHETATKTCTSYELNSQTLSISSDPLIFDPGTLSNLSNQDNEQMDAFYMELLGPTPYTLLSSHEISNLIIDTNLNQSSSTETSQAMIPNSQSLPLPVRSCDGAMKNQFNLDAFLLPPQRSSDDDESGYGARLANSSAPLSMRNQNGSINSFGSYKPPWNESTAPIRSPSHPSHSSKSFFDAQSTTFTSISTQSITAPILQQAPLISGSEAGKASSAGLPAYLQTPTSLANPDETIYWSKNQPIGSNPTDPMSIISESMMNWSNQNLSTEVVEARTGINWLENGLNRNDGDQTMSTEEILNDLLNYPSFLYPPGVSVIGNSHHTTIPSQVGTLPPSSAAASSVLRPDELRFEGGMLV